MSGRLVIDITELVSWQGKLTGVPRVINELASRFATEGGTIFVAWDDTSQCYVEVPYSPQTADILHQSSETLPPPHMLKRLVGRFRRSSRIADRAIHVSLKAAHRVRHSGPAQLLQPVFDLQAGDTLLVMADWHGGDPAFVTMLGMLRVKKVRLVQVAYDMLPIVTPQYSGHATKNFTNYVRNVYQLCDVILAISEHTKRDVLNWLGENKLTAPQVEVIRLGDDFSITTADRPHDAKLTSQLLKSKDFILCVGTIEARKNHALLYYTFKLASERGEELPPVVVVGRLGWLAEDIYEMITHDPETKDKFIFLQDATDENLAWLYQNCLFTIYPSFYEGWGLPVAESVARGVPCVCSSTSSIPEIAGDKVTYFSPMSTDECLRAIVSMLQPGALAAAKQNLETYEPASWDDTYAQVKQFIGEKH